MTAAEQLYLDNTLVAKLYPKESRPALSVGHNFSFVLNISRLADRETFTLAPGHEIRRANEAEIAAIKDVLTTHANLATGWKKWETDLDRTESGEPWFRLRPPGEWRYFVIAFEDSNSMIIEIERALCVAPVELKIGFTLATSTFELDDGSKRSFDTVLCNPGRLSSQVRALGNYLPFVELTSANVDSLPALITQIQSCDANLLDIKRITLQALDLDALPCESPLLFLGYFAILESLLTHQARPEDTIDSITRQVRQKLVLLDNRWRPRIDYSPFGTTPPEKIWSTMYGYRSCLAHGSEPNFKKDLKLLGDHDGALKLLKQTVRSVLRQALSEPQLIVDLRNC